MIDWKTLAKFIGAKRGAKKAFRVPVGIHDYQIEVHLDRGGSATLRQFPPAVESLSVLRDGVEVFRAGR